MADISDVEQALASSITSILYPASSTQSSIIGALCRIYRGWPNSATLNIDLAAGAVNVTIVTDNDFGRTTTRYLPEWSVTPTQPGVSVRATTPSISISGIPAVGDVIGALIDGQAFAYRIQIGDTSSLVAANLSTLIQTTFLVAVQGQIITVPGANTITARTVSDNSASTESRRQEKDVRIICWCPSPPIRDSVAAAIDINLDQMSFLSLPDGTKARVTYRNTASYDQAQNALLYRRDLLYTVEYPTVTSIELPSMLFGASDINGNIIYG